MQKDPAAALVAMYLSDTCLTSSCSPFLKKSPSSIKMNFGLSRDLYASIWFDGYASILQPFISNTVSLLSKVTCNLGSNNAFILLISLIAMSMLGPVTIHIWLFGNRYFVNTA